MRELAREAGLQITDGEMRDIYGYYETSSSAALPPDPIGSPIAFQRQILPFDTSASPGITNVVASDLDQDGRVDILAVDVHASAVVWVRNLGTLWSGRTLTKIDARGRVHAVACDTDGDLDVAMAALGVLPSTDERVGSFELLVNTGGGFVTSGRVAPMGRVSDVRSADFDGDLDFVVAEFGHQEVRRHPLAGTGHCRAVCFSSRGRRARKTTCR